MANPSPIPLPDARSLRSDDSASEKIPEAANGTSIPPAGPRKLVRPTLPERVLKNRAVYRRDDSGILAHHQAMNPAHNGHESTHAEAFYFQKQAQSQTPMVFILEDGERVEGVIEWYDLNAIKVKNHSRTLIYKSSIKYLYKASENNSRG